MWLMTPIGFFSVVRKPTDERQNTLTVRARVRVDLEQLQARYLPELGPVLESTTTDYRFRAVAPQAAVAQAMARLVADLDYDNFKHAVAQRQGQARADLYHEVWSVLYELQRTPQGQVHPKRDDGGQPVLIRTPSTPSAQRAWKQAEQIAALLPGGKLPASLHRVPFLPWVDAPTDSAGWEALADENKIAEPAFKVPRGLAPAAGVVVKESDGRIWFVCPTNQFGGYELTFPKGRLDGKRPQATALCEAYEESGLQVRLLRHLVDVKRSQTYTRYYLAERIGGSPADMGWESQCVMLVPLSKLNGLRLKAPDLAVIQALGTC
jgi:ADP-ribose pyrophosphatase YjhB (NUDIX family)